MKVAAAPDPWTPLTSMRRWAAEVERWIDRVVAGRWWSVRATAVAVAVGVLLASPPLGGFAPPSTPLWRFDIANSGPRLFDPHVDLDGQVGNLTFRVVPRLFGAAFGFDQTWQFYALQVLFGVLFLWAACEVFEQALGSRRLAAVLTVATACTWAGATGWVESRGLFDAYGLAFLALAMRARRWPTVLAFALAATFSDERALIVLPLVLGWHAWRSRSTERVRDVMDLRCAAVVAAAVLHLVIRTWLKHRYGLHENRNRYPQDPFTQFRNYPNGLWSAFEGLWLVVVCGLWTWVQRGRWVVAGAVAAAGSVSLLVGMSVVDVTRAIAYAWPLVPVSLLGVRHLPTGFVRRLVWVAAAICIVSPMVYAAGDQTVDWSYPALLLVPKVVVGWLT